MVYENRQGDQHRASPHDAQHDYLSGCSLPNNLPNALNTITRPMNDEEAINMGFLDFTKAFHVFNNLFLCSKLSTLWLLLQVIDWIRSYLNDHLFQVFIGDLVSEEAAVPLVSLNCPPSFSSYGKEPSNGFKVFWWLSADDTKIGGKSVDVELIQRCLDKTVA